MATPLQIKRLLAVPTTWEANTIYMIQSATTGLMDIYAVGNDVTDPRHIISEAEIDNKITTQIQTSLADLSKVEVVANIAARDALATDKNRFVMVLDASADATVTAGAATYVLDSAAVDANGNPAPTWYKVSEWESMDMTITWSMIQGKPTSLVADIDDAVAKRHVHANKVVLDALSDDGAGNLMYNGAYVGLVAITTEW